MGQEVGGQISEVRRPRGEGRKRAIRFDIPHLSEAVFPPERGPYGPEAFFYRHSEALLRPLVASGAAEGGETSDFLIFLTSCFPRFSYHLIIFVCRLMLASAIVPSMIPPPRIVRNAGISPSNTNAKMIP